VHMAKLGPLDPVVLARSLTLCHLITVLCIKLARKKPKLGKAMQSIKKPPNYQNYVFLFFFSKYSGYFCTRVVIENAVKVINYIPKFSNYIKAYFQNTKLLERPSILGLLKAMLYRFIF